MQQQLPVPGFRAGVCSASVKTSEVEGAVAVATPNDHGDREAEHGGQGSPGEGEQHGVVEQVAAV